MVGDTTIYPAFNTDPAPEKVTPIAGTIKAAGFNSRRYGAPRTDEVRPA
jgi:hypothetical protein